MKDASTHVFDRYYLKGNQCESTRVRRGGDGHEVGYEFRALDDEALGRSIDVTGMVTGARTING